MVKVLNILEKHGIKLPKLNKGLSNEVMEHCYTLDLLSEISDLSPRVIVAVLKDIGTKFNSKERHDILFKNLKKEVFNALTISEDSKTNMFKIRRLDLVEVKDKSGNRSAVKPYLSKHNEVRFSQISKGKIKMQESIETQEKETMRNTSKFSGKTARKATGKKVAVKKTAVKKAVTKVAAKKTSAKKEMVKAATDLDLTGVVTRGEGEPKAEIRQEILNLVPGGKRGIKMQALVSKITDELELTEKRAFNHVNAMANKGFVNLG